MTGIAVGVNEISVGTGVGVDVRTHALNKRMVEAMRINRFIFIFTGRLYPVRDCFGPSQMNCYLKQDIWPLAGVNLYAVEFILF